MNAEEVESQKFNMEEDISGAPLPTTEDSKSIKSISKDNVHRICSGQVRLCQSVLFS